MARLEGCVADDAVRGPPALSVSVTVCVRGAFSSLLQGKPSHLLHGEARHSGTAEPGPMTTSAPTNPLLGHGKGRVDRYYINLL